MYFVNSACAVGGGDEMLDSLGGRHHSEVFERVTQAHGGVV